MYAILLTNPHNMRFNVPLIQSRDADTMHENAVKTGMKLQTDRKYSSRKTKKLIGKWQWSCYIHQAVYPINAKTKENSSLTQTTHCAVKMSTNMMYTFIHHLHKVDEIKTKWSCYACRVHHRFNTASTVRQTELYYTYYLKKINQHKKVKIKFLGIWYMTWYDTIWYDIVSISKQFLMFLRNSYNKTNEMH